jgi:hypothetical protein
MEQTSKIKNLQTFLRVFGFLTILVMCINLSAFVFQIEAFRPGNSMHWLLWDDITGHVGPMILIIYIVWGIYFFKVAKDPLKHKSFLDFTMWANLGHGLIMIPMAIQDPAYHLRFLTDIPFVLLIAIGIYLWRPLPETKPVYNKLK